MDGSGCQLLRWAAVYGLIGLYDWDPDMEIGKFAGRFFAVLVEAEKNGPANFRNSLMKAMIKLWINFLIMRLPTEDCISKVYVINTSTAVQFSIHPQQ